MKKTLLLLSLLYLQLSGMGQAYFPSDQSTGKISFHKTEEIAVSKADKYNRVKTWFMNYYKISRFEDQFRVTKKGKPVYLVENKNKNSIAGRCGFYIMYPLETSGLVMEQTFVMFTMTISFTNTGYKNQISDIICFSSKTTSNVQDMRPPEYGLEAYNERRLNDRDYVQQYIIPQVNNSIRKVQEELSRNIRYGNLTEAGR
ncbi:hypothetical protein [Sediminibacterium sp.]|uniref:hypothetical protein n=1 Tax=Sediminibacterium sp. TaxID=1917865 RepID=UPI0025D93066|nr:hypothetical protein [Sediminibacterium sp.]MBW0177000.1 DUF4468 domain-containing protein [Sediminibacterium sp.]